MGVGKVVGQTLTVKLWLYKSFRVVDMPIVLITVYPRLVSGDVVFFSGNIWFFCLKFQNQLFIYDGVILWLIIWLTIEND